MLVLFIFSTMNTRWLIAGCLFAALSVVFGAFGAHGLEEYLKNGLMTERQFHNFDTASRYQMYHALGLLFSAFVPALASSNRWLKLTPYFFLAGILLFSGSLYLLSVRDVIGLKHWHWLGPITPLGGICFIVGWLFLAIGVYTNSKKKSEQ